MPSVHMPSSAPLTSEHRPACELQAPWLLMIETDYVWMKPPVASAAEGSARSLGFPFGYIQPTSPGIESVLRKMFPAERGPLSDVPNSGPAPVLMRWNELFKVQAVLRCCADCSLPSWSDSIARSSMHLEQAHIRGAPSSNGNLIACCYPADHARLGAADEAHRGRQGDEGQAGLGAGDVCLVHWRSSTGKAVKKLSTVTCAIVGQPQHEPLHEPCSVAQHLAQPLKTSHMTGCQLHVSAGRQV